MQMQIILDDSYTELHKWLATSTMPYHSVIRLYPTQTIQSVLKTLSDNNLSSLFQYRTKNNVVLDLGRNMFIYIEDDGKISVNTTMLNNQVTKFIMKYGTSAHNQMVLRTTHKSSSNYIDFNPRFYVNPTIETCYEHKLLHKERVQEDNNIKDNFIVAVDKGIRSKRIKLSDLLKTQPDEDGNVYYKGQIVMCKHEWMIRNNMSMEQIKNECYNEVIHGCRFCHNPLPFSQEIIKMDLDLPDFSLRLYNSFVKIMDEIGFDLSSRRLEVLTACVEVIYNYYMENVNDKLDKIDSLSTFLMVVDDGRIDLLMSMLLYSVFLVHPEFNISTRSKKLTNRLANKFKQLRITPEKLNLQISKLDITGLLGMITTDKLQLSNVKSTIELQQDVPLEMKPKYTFPKLDLPKKLTNKHSPTKVYTTIYDNKYKQDTIYKDAFNELYCPFNIKHTFNSQNICINCKYKRGDKITTQTKDLHLDIVHPLTKKEQINHLKQFKLSSDEINNILKAVTQQFNIGMMKLNSVIISLSSYIEECYKCYPYDNSVPLNTKFAILYNDSIFNIELFDRIQQLVEDSADNTVVVKDTNDVSKKE